MPYARVNCLKTIPFTAAHTYKAHIWQYPLPGFYGMSDNEYCWFLVSRHSKQIKIKIKNVQQIKSRNWEMKESKYARTLAKILVTAILLMQDMLRIFYPDLQRFVWRRHGGAHPHGHRHGGRKPTETSVTELCYKSVNLSLEEL